MLAAPALCPPALLWPSQSCVSSRSHSRSRSRLFEPRSMFTIEPRAQSSTADWNTEHYIVYKCLIPECLRLTLTETMSAVHYPKLFANPSLLCVIPAGVEPGGRRALEADSVACTRNSTSRRVCIHDTNVQVHVRKTNATGLRCTRRTRRVWRAPRAARCAPPPRSSPPPASTRSLVRTD